MGNILNYLWLILLVIYIISPLDAHPLFLDDLLAAAVLFYMLYRNTLKKKQRQYYYSQFESSEKSGDRKEHPQQGEMTLDAAYRLLDVNQASSWEDITKSYKEKVSKSHPDKVSHLSKELQDKAEELTLRLNQALTIIKHHRK